MAKQSLLFNAYDLNAFLAHPGNRHHGLIPSLSTGTMPAGQGSKVAAVTPVATVVASNEVPSPTPSGASTFDSSGSLPVTTPIQNLAVPPTAQPAPWVRISPCAKATNFRVAARLGLISAMS